MELEEPLLSCREKQITNNHRSKRQLLLQLVYAHKEFANTPNFAGPIPRKGKMNEDSLHAHKEFANYPNFTGPIPRKG